MQREKVKKLIVKITRARKMLDDALSTLNDARYDMNDNLIQTSLQSFNDSCAEEEIKAWLDDARYLLNDISYRILAPEKEDSEATIPIPVDEIATVKDETADDSDNDLLPEFMF